MAKVKDLIKKKRYTKAEAFNCNEQDGNAVVEE